MRGTQMAWQRKGLIFGTLTVLAGIALGSLRFVGSGGGVDGGWGIDDHLGGSLAMGLAIAATGIMALWSRRDRPLLAVAAGLGLVPMAIISVVALPAVFLAIGMVIAGTSAPSPTVARPSLRSGVTILLVAALHVASMMALIFHEDPRSVQTAVSAASTSDVISWAEVAISLTCVFLAFVAAAVGMPREELQPELPPPPDLVRAASI